MFSKGAVDSMKTTATLETHFWRGTLAGGMSDTPPYKGSDFVTMQVVSSCTKLYEVV